MNKFKLKVFMKNIFIRIAALITFLLIIPFEAFTQCRESPFAIHVGSGITYGGSVGVMAVVMPSSDVSIIGAIGKYSGPPLAFGAFGGVMKDDVEFKLSKDTQTGMGYSIGIKFHPNDLGLYTGIQYISAGKYNDGNMEISLPGINWSMFGGTHSMWNSNFVIDWAINLALLFPGDYLGAMFGISLGLGYEF